MRIPSAAPSPFGRAVGSANNLPSGSLARIGPNQLVTNDPEVLRTVNGTSSPFKRSDWFDALRFDGVRDNVLSQRDIEKHKILRAKLAQGVSRSGQINMLHTSHGLDNSTLAKKSLDLKRGLMAASTK